MKRTLSINKTTLWISIPTGYTDKLDGDGFNTGERVRTFSTPVEVKITIYPSNGAIIEQLFGKDAKLDMVALSNDVALTKDSLIFLNEPSDNYATTYDYRVDNIRESLNTFQYGLKKRT